MKYIPQEITDFLTSNLENDYADWSHTTTYNQEDVPLTNASVVRYGNYYYRSLIDDNLAIDINDTPDKSYNIDKKWILWGISNRQAMVDLRSATKSIIDTTPLYITNGTTQVVTTAIDDLILYDVAGGGGTVGVTYKAKTVQASIDLDLEDFTNATNWEVAIEDIIVTFDKNFISALAIGYYTASTLKIEILDDIDTVLFTITETQSANNSIYDYFDYMYDPYTTEVDRNKYFQLPQLGTKIRVTAEREPESVTSSIGFLIAGEEVDMGKTLDNVSFSFNSYSVKTTDDFGIINIVKRGVQELVDFETKVDSNIVISNKRKLKTLYDDIVAFVLDPEGDTYENLISLGTIESASVIVQNSTDATMAYSVSEVI